MVADTKTFPPSAGASPLGGLVGSGLRVIAAQPVLTGHQQMGAGAGRGQADVQRGGGVLQQQQLTGGTNSSFRRNSSRGAKVQTLTQR